MNYFGNLPKIQKIQKILDFKCYIQGTSYLIVDLQSGSSLQLEPRVLYWQFNHENAYSAIGKLKAEKRRRLLDETESELAAFTPALLYKAFRGEGG